MTLFIQKSNTEEVLYQMDEFFCVPDVGDSIRIGDTWYYVVERYYYFNQTTHNTGNSVSIFVEEDKSY